MMALPSDIVNLLDSKRRDQRNQVRIGLVGASNDPRKYGWIILQDLLKKGFQVIPINPTTPNIAGLKAYPEASAIPGQVDLLNFVVPPEVSLKVMASLDPSRFHALWFQPGAFDQSALDYAKGRFKQVVAGPCIMVEARS